MVWKNAANSLAKSASHRETTVSSMGAIVGRLVGALRRRGMKAEIARAAAARHLGITPRRVRSYLSGEVETVSAHEALAITEGWQKAVRAQMATLEAEIEAECAALMRLETRCESVSALLSAVGGSEP